MKMIHRKAASCLIDGEDAWYLSTPGSDLAS